MLPCIVWHSACRYLMFLVVRAKRSPWSHLGWHQSRALCPCSLQCRTRLGDTINSVLLCGSSFPTSGFIPIGWHHLSWESAFSPHPRWGGTVCYSGRLGETGPESKKVEGPERLVCHCSVSDVAIIPWGMFTESIMQPFKKPSRQDTTMRRK